MISSTQDTFKQEPSETLHDPTGQVVRTGFTDGMGAAPEFSFSTLLQRSAGTIARMKQLKTCMDVWYARHTA